MTATKKATQPSMKAWRIHEFGPPENMICETIPRPCPAAGEVLVKISCSGRWTVGRVDQSRQECITPTSTSHSWVRLGW